MAWDSITTISSDKHTHIVYAYGTHIVKFLYKTLTVTSLSLATEDCPIPEVCTYIAVFLALKIELSILNCDKRGSFLCPCNQSKQTEEKEQTILFTN